MIITNIPHKIKLNQITYNNIVYSIDLDSIICTSCKHHDWAFHASYFRYVDFLNRRLKIRIMRVICLSCGITHAILIKDIIPFSSLSHSDIINVLSSYEPGLVDPSHFYYLKAKYLSIDFYDYSVLCHMNQRSYPLILFST